MVNKHATNLIVQDKLNHFWIVSKRDLEEKKAELRNKERELEDLQEKHDVEIKVRLHALSF